MPTTREILWSRDTNNITFTGIGGNNQKMPRRIHACKRVVSLWPLKQVYVYEA